MEKSWGGADLTFAILFAVELRSECQIQSSTQDLYFLVVLMILTFARSQFEAGCECENRTTRLGLILN